MTGSLTQSNGYLMRRKIKDIILKSLIYASILFTVGMLIWIVGDILVKGIGHISWAFVTNAPNDPIQGVFPMIVSTLYLVGLGLVIACPIGIFSAIFLTEYARQGKIVKIIRFATESLAGIPSIVYGLFGFLFFVTTLKWGWTIIAGACTVSIMILPTVVRATEEAIKSVPDTYREASLGLGASKLRTIFKVVLPSALPGILSAVILSMGRIVGETAAIILTMGSDYGVPKGINRPGCTLSVFLYKSAKEMGAEPVVFATATVLILTVLVLNTLANLASKYISRNGGNG